MSLASAGDFSKVHVCMPDFLVDTCTESQEVDDRPAKDGVLFQFAKGINKGMNDKAYS